MKAWHFSEQAYYPAFQLPGPMRVTLSQKHCNPVLAGQLLNRYIDEYMVADELGFDIMVNEHHASATCMSTSCMATLGILARQTRNARLLALGIPLGNRSDPLRVAEEIAMVDAISGGRLEVGLVKGAAFELFMSNQAPVRFMDRFWEAHDLILEALTNTEDNFAWNGEFFQYRTVSLWPPPIQQPPPIWMTASSPGSAAAIGKLGYTCATFLSGAVARQVFDAYRAAYREAHGAGPSDDKLGYLAIVAVAHNRDEAFRRAEQMRGFFDTGARVETQFRAPPGFMSVADTVRMMKSRPTNRPEGHHLPAYTSIQQYIDDRLMFVGTPDDVYSQLKSFYLETGGFGNLMMMGQAAELNHADTVDSLSLFAKEVAPRIAGLSSTTSGADLQALA